MPEPTEQTQQGGATSWRRQQPPPPPLEFESSFSDDNMLPPPTVAFSCVGDFSRWMETSRSLSVNTEETPLFRESDAQYLRLILTRLDSMGTTDIESLGMVSVFAPLVPYRHNGTHQSTNGRMEQVSACLCSLEFSWIGDNIGQTRPNSSKNCTCTSVAFLYYVAQSAQSCKVKKRGRAAMRRRY
jgi:hypothetical protein